MVKIFALIISSIIIVGCSSTPEPRIEFREKKVPIIIVPAPAVVEKPTLDVETLSDAESDDPNKVAQAYVLSLKAAQMYANQLEAVIKKYKDLSDKNPELPAEATPVR